MWTASERGDWLLSFAAHMIGKNGWPTHQQVVLAACQCARLAIKHATPGENRPIIAIETAEAWANGETTIDQVRIAGGAADYIEDDNTAYCAAMAASDAAWAVYATEDGADFRLAQAAGGAATWAAWAAMRATNDFGKLSDSVEKAVLKECADIVRRMLKIPNELTNELPLYNWVRRWHTNSRGQPTGRMQRIPISVSRCNPAYVLKGDELDNQSINPVLRATSTLLVCAAAWVLIGALNKNPIQYYTMLRWLTCSTAVVLVWRGVIQGSCKWAYLLVPIAIIFNPIVPIHLQGNRLAMLRTWQTLDVVTAVAMVLTLTLMELQVVLAKKRRLGLIGRAEQCHE